MYFQNPNFEKKEIGLQVQIFFEWLNQFSTMKNDFENQNFEMFKETVDNFGKSDSDILVIEWKMLTYFH